MPGELISVFAPNGALLYSYICDGTYFPTPSPYIMNTGALPFYSPSGVRTPTFYQCPIARRAAFCRPETPGTRRVMGWVMQHAVAIVSALLAAFWAALGIVIRQRVAQSVPADNAISAAVTASVVRDPLWWAGTLAAVAGYAFQALALAHGSLLLVQPLLVSSLLFALPMSARLCHQRITRAEWGWAALLTAALAVFVCRLPGAWGQCDLILPG